MCLPMLTTCCPQVTQAPSQMAGIAGKPKLSAKDTFTKLDGAIKAAIFAEAAETLKRCEVLSSDSLKEATLERLKEALTPHTTTNVTWAIGDAVKKEFCDFLVSKNETALLGQLALCGALSLVPEKPCVTERCRFIPLALQTFSESLSPPPYQLPRRSKKDKKKDASGKKAPKSAQKGKLPQSPKKSMAATAAGGGATAFGGGAAAGGAAAAGYGAAAAGGAAAGGAAAAGSAAAGSAAAAGGASEVLGNLISLLSTNKITQAQFNAALAVLK